MAVPQEQLISQGPMEKLIRNVGIANDLTALLRAAESIRINTGVEFIPSEISTALQEWNKQHFGEVFNLVLDLKGYQRSGANPSLDQANRAEEIVRDAFDRIKSLELGVSTD